MRVMFDTNAYDHILDSDGDLEKIISSDKYTYYITSMQIEEIANIPDTRKEKRIRLLLLLCKIRAHLVPTPAVVDKARVDYCNLVGEDDVYTDLSNTPKNVEDAMIGSAANREHCIVVTDDRAFKKRLKRQTVSAMSYEEFIRNLES